MIFNHCPPVEIPDLVKVTGKDGKRYYTTPDGDRFPSVTTVIGYSSDKKQSLMEWRQRVGEEEANRVSRAASGRGTRMHILCEDYLNNNNPRPTMPDAKAMFNSLTPYLNRINNIHFQEKSLWSKQLKLAGTVDCIAEYCGVLSIIDFKTSSRPKTKEDIKDYFLQCTAYSLMYEELTGLTIDQLVVIMAVEYQKPLVFIQKTEDYIVYLVKAIKKYEARK